MGGLRLGKIANHRFASAITPNANPQAAAAHAQGVLPPFADQGIRACCVRAVAIASADTCQKGFLTPTTNLPRTAYENRERSQAGQLCVRFLPKLTQRRKRLDRFSIRMSKARTLYRPAHDDL